MKNIFMLMGIFFVFTLSGCEETKSVSWWIDHHDDALKKEAECKKSGSDSKNCQNVKEANFRWQQLHAKEPDYEAYFKKHNKEHPNEFK